LNDFPVQTPHTPLRPFNGDVSPKCTGCVDSSADHSLAPGDFAIIYDVNPLYDRSIDGRNQVIAIVGSSMIHLSDVTSFRSLFGLPATVAAGGAPVVVQAPPSTTCSDPGFAPSEDEADLDVEWSGAVARNARIEYIPCGSLNGTPGAYLSAAYIVDTNQAPVMSMSFSECETYASSILIGNKTLQAWINDLWEQASLQGISVFVSSGDSGAAGCDGSSASVATHGTAVNALCSTPYDVCVGGTEFYDLQNPGDFWLPTAPDPVTKATARSYIPEHAWNESANQAGGEGLGQLVEEYPRSTQSHLGRPFWILSITGELCPTFRLRPLNMMAI
jgi:subtilase family serine protease